MANEFKLSISLSSSLGAKPTHSYSISTSPANANATLGAQDATTSATAITVVASGRWLYIENTDTTNFVNIGVDASVATPIAKLRPLDVCIIPFAAATTYYWKADTATCKMVAFTIT